MPDVVATPVAFEEANEFLRNKVNIPSRRFDELRGAIHAKGFTVAGATKAQLLADLRSAVQQALEQGQTITDFRKSFDEIVGAHGWSYKGRRGWRTRVIYDTNMRSARMAGRWEQIQRVKERRPYLQYLTAGDTRVRPEHELWDQTILLSDDPWWNTHYPPNGWGCRCTVRTLNQRQLERRGLAVNRAPAIKTNERINTRTGEVYGDVPDGIDTGFDFNVGKAWLAPETAFGELIAALPPATRSAALGSLSAVADQRLSAPYKTWAREVIDSDTAGSQVAVGYLNESVFSFLESRQIGPTSATITLLDSHLRRMRRDIKRRVGKALPDDVLLDIPRALLVRLPFCMTSAKGMPRT